MRTDSKTGTTLRNHLFFPRAFLQHGCITRFPQSTQRISFRYPFTLRDVGWPALNKHSFSAIIRTQVAHVQQNSCKTIGPNTRRVVVMHSFFSVVFDVIKVRNISGSFVVSQYLQAVPMSFKIFIETQNIKTASFDFHCSFTMSIEPIFRCSSCIYSVSRGPRRTALDFVCFRCLSQGFSYKVIRFVSGEEVVHIKNSWINR
mmetsp:Transcript_10620/g.16219  ORF Transcript_10620/g.16219 Transcript_10620/m.16219 type:complete len:202 (-) Transcript_10620:192-797(-)